MTIVQIALAVKDIPFEDIVFLQYPTYTDPDNPNKVVPNEDAATAMWDAITATQQLQITHENTANDGAVVQEPATPETPAQPETTVPATPAPTDTAAPLPEDVRGTSAAQTTCSNGNVRQ
jgi:hypothetical protein